MAERLPRFNISFLANWVSAIPSTDTLLFVLASDVTYFNVKLAKDLPDAGNLVTM